jgi:hypothetical protein
MSLSDVKPGESVIVYRDDGGFWSIQYRGQSLGQWRAPEVTRMLRRAGFVVGSKGGVFYRGHVPNSTPDTAMQTATEEIKLPTPAEIKAGQKENAALVEKQTEKLCAYCYQEFLKAVRPALLSQHKKRTDFFHWCFPRLDAPVWTEGYDSETKEAAERQARTLLGNRLREVGYKVTPVHNDRNWEIKIAWE